MKTELFVSDIHRLDIYSFGIMIISLMKCEPFLAGIWSESYVNEFLEDCKKLSKYKMALRKRDAI